MTVSQAISIARALRPCELEDALLQQLLQEVEARAALLRDNTSKEHACMIANTEQLAVPAPYDGLYWRYLLAVIDLAASNREAYMISRAEFEQAFDDYARYCQRTGGGV